MINNRLDKSFGPVGSFSGIVVFIAGLVSVYFSLFAFILVLIGAFVGFSYSSTWIDMERQRVRFSNNIFGLIKTGPWVQIENNMKIGIKKSNQVWRSYSRSNRTLDIANEDYRLILYNLEGKMVMPIKKTDNLLSAKTELQLMCNQMGLSQI